MFRLSDRVELESPEKESLESKTEKEKVATGPHIDLQWMHCEGVNMTGSVERGSMWISWLWELKLLILRYFSPIDFPPNCIIYNPSVRITECVHFPRGQATFGSSRALTFTVGCRCQMFSTSLQPLFFWILLETPKERLSPNFQILFNTETEKTLSADSTWRSGSAPRRCHGRAFELGTGGN